MKLGHVILVAFLANGTCGAQGGHEQDVYSIYSLLLTDPETSHGRDDNARYLILDTTVQGMPTQPCLNARGEKRASMTEILADFEKRKDQPRKLKGELTLGKPYDLLSESEANQFRRRNGNPDWRARFAGVTDLFSFSEVYFDKAGTMAMTFMSSWCGSLCALFQWKLLEKKDGKWREIPGVGCMAVAVRSEHVAPRPEFRLLVQFSNHFNIRVVGIDGAEPEGGLVGGDEKVRSVLEERSS